MFKKLLISLTTIAAAILVTSALADEMSGGSMNPPQNPGPADAHNWSQGGGDVRQDKENINRERDKIHHDEQDLAQAKNQLREDMRARNHEAARQDHERITALNNNIRQEKEDIKRLQQDIHHDQMAHDHGDQHQDMNNNPNMNQ